MRQKRQPLQESTAEIRARAQQWQKRRDELMMETLLGMDDGTTEAAMDESLDFDKFMDIIVEDEDREAARQAKQLDGVDSPALALRKKFNESRVGSHTYRR